VHELGERIVRGDLAPGDVLDVDGITREFDASRPAVREVIRVLAAKGLVDARPKRGTFVRPREEWHLLDPDLLRWQLAVTPDTDFLAQLSEVREIIEPAGAVLAARRRSVEQLSSLRRSLEVMGDPKASVETIVAADLAFHRGLLQAAGNELLSQMEIVIELGLQVRDFAVSRIADWQSAVPSHIAVLDAIAASDPAGAETAMRALLQRAGTDERGLRASRSGERPS
jgi:DNA-binding FadR family transcriptional regulator